MESINKLKANSRIELLKFITDQKTFSFSKIQVFLDILIASKNGLIKNNSTRQIFLSIENPETKYCYNYFTKSIRDLSKIDWITVDKSDPNEVVLTINSRFIESKRSVELLTLILEKKSIISTIKLFLDFIAIADKNGHYESNRFFGDLYDNAQKPFDKNCTRYMNKLCEFGLVKKHSKTHYSYDNKYWR